jgi:phosphoribosylaminoimidazolecarboxamide formyltransferase/IMP cyclohydrolase
MSDKKLSAMYRQIHPDLFPRMMEISFYDDQQRQTLFYEKVDWVVDGERKGLRYGENPDQEAALYRLQNGNLCLGEVECIRPGRYLASDVELLQSGKHPGKINITDADAALSILRYFEDEPAVAIIKHNNPCGVAVGRTTAEAYQSAFDADRIAAFGGAVGVNRQIDEETARLIASHYTEVVVAPSYSEHALQVLSERKNLRVLRIENMERLSSFVGARVVDLHSLVDGGVIVQWSAVPVLPDPESMEPAGTEHKGVDYAVRRRPTPREARDMRMAWIVAGAVTSNSIVYVRDGVTVGIGTGEQDRVGAAEIARDKAHRKALEREAWRRHGTSYSELDDAKSADVDEAVKQDCGGLKGAAMASDGFFPFRDGLDVGVSCGVTAVIQPGGSLRDWEVIEACNEQDVAMVFTGQRAFKH